MKRGAVEIGIDNKDAGIGTTNNLLQVSKEVVHFTSLIDLPNLIARGKFEFEFKFFDAASYLPLNGLYSRFPVRYAGFEC